MALSAIQRRRRLSVALAPPQASLTSPGGAGVVTGLPLLLLRSEGVAVLPAPDLGLLGNLRSRRAGVVAYDLTHTSLPPAALALVGVVTGSGLAVALALVWFAHIGMGRALGLGLQYPDGSGRTHLRETRQRRNGAGLGGDAWSG